MKVIYAVVALILGFAESFRLKTSIKTNYNFELHSEVNLWSKFKDAFSPKLKTTANVALRSLDESIESNRTVLVNAATTKRENPDDVIESLLSLEKLMRKRNAADGGLTGNAVLGNLNGAWRLIFTTGTIDTQKKIGKKINYFPIKAAQCFDTTSMTLTNGIYVGDFAVFKFFGPFEFNTISKKLVRFLSFSCLLFSAQKINHQHEILSMFVAQEFDFDEIAVLGLRFKLPKGGAAKIGSSTGTQNCFCAICIHNSVCAMNSVIAHAVNMSYCQDVFPIITG